MGDTACVMQPFSYTAGISNDANEGNPIHALGQSVSFGRFVSDSLSWEKWSSFSHNRYVEEAEKFSRPGSVAQKKAFFEAHYRNLAARKAAALLEQANAAANNVQEPENENGIHDNTTQDSQTVATVSQVADDQEEVHVQQVNSEASFVADDNACNFNAGMERLENSNVEEVEPFTENEVLVENCVKINTLNQIANVDNKEEVKEAELSVTKQMEKPLLKDFMSYNDDSAASLSKKKPAVSSSKSLVYGKASKLPSTPAKVAASVRAKKENAATPISKKYAIDAMERRRTTPKSTHKSMNFTPVRGINRITSSIIRKIDSSRVGSNSKSSKDCPTPSRTPLLVPIAESKHPLATPRSENRRAKTPIHPSTSGSKTVRSKWHFLPTDCSMFMNSSRNKSQSPSSSIPFSFRTEERAARRKEKLEEKFNAYQAQKVQQQATLKEKAETEIKRLRQSLCFKARPLPDFYKQRVAPKNQMEKVPLTHSESPELGRKVTPSKVRSTSQLNQWSSLKNSGSKHVMHKKSDNPRSLASRLKASAHENTSPNIQHE